LAKHAHSLGGEIPLILSGVLWNGSLRVHLFVQNGVGAILHRSVHRLALRVSDEAEAPGCACFTGIIGIFSQFNGKIVILISFLKI
jgi:hypothetical protein